ncbi:MAG: nucleotide exchange factor GrpE [Clostridium sp.]
MEENKEFKEDLQNEDVQEEIVEELTEENENVEAEQQEEVIEDSNETESSEENGENMLFGMRKIKDENKRLTNENEALKDRLLRISAEYENFRKRTSKEKDGIYTDACFDVLKEMLPVVDNLERALSADGTVDDLKKGVEMTIKGVSNSFEKLGVEEIDASGEFDPNLHQAVMHVQDENFGTNSIAEVFQKGYKKGDKVLRYTMVKVAN